MCTVHVYTSLEKMETLDVEFVYKRDPVLRKYFEGHSQILNWKTTESWSSREPCNYTKMSYPRNESYPVAVKTFMHSLVNDTAANL